MKILSKRLREARINAGLKQMDAAKILSVSNGTLSGYEKNFRDPDTTTLLKMAELYEVSVDWLLDNPPPIKGTFTDSMSVYDIIMLYIWRQMSIKDKQEALDIIQYILLKRKSNNYNQNNNKTLN